MKLKGNIEKNVKIRWCKVIKGESFHTRCHINNKVCSIIIGSESYDNTANITFVRKLNLNTIKHERPYRLQWLNDYGEVRITKWVLISFSIVKYKDDVLCDVVLIHATHLLLGRLWQFNRKAKHDELKNMYSLKEDGKTFTLVPLSLRQV